MAVSPLAIPLTLNPVGVVALVIASSEVTDLASSIAVVVLIWVVMGINLAVLPASDMWPNICPRRRSNCLRWYWGFSWGRWRFS